ncbi:PKD domain-containing protein [Lentzea waywayandensis]|nr:PKD domain-containing protein [Lentzea waywayandensis]
MPSWRPIAVVAAAVLGMLVPGVAHAAPPANDDFDASTAITALPFTVEQNTSEATKASDDSFWCQPYDSQGSVWFHYTATETGLLRATSAGSGREMIISAQTGLRGELRGVENACSVGSRYPMTFRVTAGTTYYFLISGYGAPGGALKFSLDKVAPAANDAFAAAEPVSALPFSAQPDASVASYEADEPESTCVYDERKPSVWYSYTPTTSALSVVPKATGNEAAVTVYTGDDITSLSQIACSQGNSWSPAVFRANPGTTYFLRFTSSHANYGYEPVSVSLSEAPPLQPYMMISSDQLNVFSEVVFQADSYGDIDGDLTVAWDFGDGTTTPAKKGSVRHQYRTDGTYQVTMRASTDDGRTATKTAPVTIETHDVGITKFVVPASARAGQSKPITVHVANTRYAERATVTLYKSDGGSWTEVGRSELEVPAHPTRKVQFPFAYTFTPQDAVVGKVSFRAVVSLDYPVRDARAVDNEVISIAATVRPAATTTAVAN